MKATGIVRRIDDLGRVVIPKEIRRTMRIREGDPLEIFTDREGEVILKKYSPIGELGEFATEYADSLNQVTGHIVCVTDKDTVVTISGTSKKEYTNKKVSLDLENIIKDKKTTVYNKGTGGNYHKIHEEDAEQKYTSQVIAPIVSQGDPIGAFIIISTSPDVTMDDVEIKLAETAAGFLGRQMDQ